MRVERLIHGMAATHGLPSQAGHRWCLVLGERGNQELAVRYGRTSRMWS